MSRDERTDATTRWLREQDTARTPVDAEPPAFLFALGDRLERERTAAKRATRVRAAWAVSLASLVVVAVITVSSMLATPPAVASTPVPLTFSSPAPESQVIADAIARLSKPGGIDEPSRAVRMVSWAISVEDGKLSKQAVPQVLTLDWNADLSGTLLIVKGRVEGASGESVGRVVPTRSVISKQTFKPGEFGVPSADPPAQSAQGVQDLLTAVGMPPEPSAGQVVDAMVTAMQLWTLSDGQQAQLLTLIATHGGESLGESTDRLGRRVLGIRLPSAAKGAEDTVLISPKTGRIVGVETQRTTAADGIPAGVVVDYQLWETTKESK
ncbi:hypothetical protein [Microbacterium sp.]|uniref:hypothetical protein n=1 Tax=Microbacterium sp. TaxID=51671 RepID=UPI003C783B3B